MLCCCCCTAYVMCAFLYNIENKNAEKKTVTTKNFFKYIIIITRKKNYNNARPIVQRVFSSKIIFRYLRPPRVPAAASSYFHYNVYTEFVFKILFFFYTYTYVRRSGAVSVFTRISYATRNDDLPTLSTVARSGIFSPKPKL